MVVEQCAAAVAVIAQVSVEILEVAVVGGWRAVAAGVEPVSVEAASAVCWSAVEGGMSAAQHDWQSLLLVRQPVLELAG